MITQLPKAEDLARLSAEARQILGVVGLLAPYPFRPDVIAAAFQPSAGRKLWQWLRRQSLPVVDIEAVWDELLRTGLLRRESDRLVVANEVVYELAHQLSVAEPVVKELIHTYEELARAHEVMTDEHKQELDAERPHLLAILRLCQGKRNWVTIRNISLSLRNYWQTHPDLGERIEMHEIMIAAAHRLRSDIDIAITSDFLGDAQWWARSYEEGLRSYQTVIDFSPGEEVTCDVLLKLAKLHFNLENWEEALHILQKAQNLGANLRQHKIEAKCLHLMGLVYTVQNQWDNSEKVLDRALQIASALLESSLEADIEKSLAELYIKQQHLEQAQTHYERALWFYEQLGDKHQQILLHTNIGDVLYELSKWLQALAHFGDAMGLAVELEDSYHITASHCNCGNVYFQIQKFRQAMFHFQEAARLNVEQEKIYYQDQILYSLGLSAFMVGEYAIAQIVWQERLDLLEAESAVNEEKVYCWRYLGFIACECEEWEQALFYYQLCLQNAQSIGDVQRESAELDNIAEVYRKQGMMDEAVPLYEQALALADPDGEILWHLGSVYRDQGNYAAATGYYEQAISVAQENEDELTEAESRWEMGLMFVDSDPAKALELLRPRLYYYQRIEHTDADQDATFLAELEQRLSS